MFDSSSPAVFVFGCIFDNGMTAAAACRWREQWCTGDHIPLHPPHRQPCRCRPVISVAAQQERPPRNSCRHDHRHSRPSNLASSSHSRAFPCMVRRRIAYFARRSDARCCCFVPQRHRVWGQSASERRLLQITPSIVTPGHCTGNCDSVSAAEFPSAGVSHQRRRDAFSHRSQPEPLSELQVLEDHSLPTMLPVRAKLNLKELSMKILQNIRVEKTPQPRIGDVAARSSVVRASKASFRNVTVAQFNLKLWAEVLYILTTAYTTTTSCIQSSNKIIFDRLRRLLLLNR